MFQLGHYPDILGRSLCFISSPEVQQIPAVTEHWGDSGGDGELEVLQVDPHGSRHQPGLLGCRDEVDWELDSGLKLVAQSDLNFIPFRFWNFMTVAPCRWSQLANPRLSYN